MIENYDSVGVFVGDVGKGGHHAVAYDRTGKVLLDKARPNDEAKLREVIGKLKKHDQVLMVVDQPATIGACRSPSLRPRTSSSATYRAWPCVASPTSTQVRRKLMPAPFPTRCGPFNWPMNRSRDY